MDTFGPALRRLRTERGLSLRSLSARVNYDYGYLGQLERGARQPTANLAAACDRALDADGTLVRLYEDRTEEGEMQRRNVLRTLSTLAVGGTPPLMALEALRQGIGHCIDANHDEWRQIVTDYGHAYYTTPADELLRHLTTDLTVLNEMIISAGGRHRTSLLRVAGQLSVLVALTLVATGQRHLARRWWSTARRAADQSNDVDTQVMVRGWEVVNGCYDGRPLAQVIALSDEAVGMAGRKPKANPGVAGMLAGRAQAYSLAGRHAEAAATLQQVAEITDQLPSEVVNDVESLWCWPEHRLRHTESYVYTHGGDLVAADAAQERALRLYPATQVRLRTQVQLHRAACLVRNGYIGEGLCLATKLLDSLSIDQHNALVYEMARQVIVVVPEAERRRVEALDLYERLPVAVGHQL